MKRSSLILALTAGFLVLGFGALDARAGFVPLPTTLDQFVNSSGTSNGNFTSVSNPAAGETIGFSSFGYTQATGAPPAASGVHMTPFTLPPPPGETGIQFSGAFNAPAGVTNDWVLTYTVTELTPGAKLTDAYSSITGTNNGGTGGISVSETFTTLTGQPIGTLAVNLANPTATLSRCWLYGNSRDQGHRRYRRQPGLVVVRHRPGLFIQRRARTGLIGPPRHRHDRIPGLPPFLQEDLGRLIGLHRPIGVPG